jgi:phospholipase/carboxylesterase
MRSFQASYSAASKWLDELVSELGFGFDKVVLGGFSQGGAMTYALGLGAGRPRPAGLIALSSFVPTVEGLELDLSPPLPSVAIGHGTLDNVIGVEWGRRARALLEDAGADVLYRETPMFHQVDPEFIRTIAEWLPI